MSYVETSFMRRGREVSAYRNVATGQFASETDVVTYTFLWHSMGDACQQCLPLNGREWNDQDLFGHTLWDPIWGDIYDLDAGQPLTHGGSGKNCRCQVEVLTHVDLMRDPAIQEFNLTIGGITL